METNEMVGAAAKPIRLDFATGKLLSSDNACDKRKGRDVCRVLQLSAAQWAGSVKPICALPGANRSLLIVLELVSHGLVWDQTPAANDNWTLVLAMRNNYPLSQPGARFMGVIPYNPHVSHRSFVPDERGLTPELQQYVAALRRGDDGSCCFVRSNQWCAAATHDLALVIWQVSRLITGAAFYGELGALNRHAVGHYLRLSEAGGLPLGPPLPFPFEGPANADTPPASGFGPAEQGTDVEWSDDDDPGESQ